VVYPRCFNKGSDFLTEIISNDLTAKETYCRLLDSQYVSVQEARYVLSHSMETFIHMDIALSALIPLFEKRTCMQTQTWEMILAMEKMKATLEARLPKLSNLLQTQIDKGTSWYLKIRNSSAVTHFFAPEGKYDVFDWNPKTFAYGERTHREMSSGPEIPNSFYHGFEEITEEKYKELSYEYHN
jgi:hypothetical protein